MARAPKTFRARYELPAKEPIDEEKVKGVSAATDEEPMDNDRLSGIVDGQINDAENYESTDLIQLRERALKFFEGEVDIPSVKGRSSVVSRDVSDTHGLIMPSLMRVFLATDNIAIYNPSTKKDEPFAKQATEYVNYVVMKECAGYIQFRSTFHNGLLMGNGPIKHWWDDTPEYSTENFSGLSDDAFTMLAMDPEVEVVEHSEYEDPSWVPPPPMPMGGMPAPQSGLMPPPSMGGGLPVQPPMLPPSGIGEMPPPQAPKLHDGKIKRMTSNGRLRVMALAPEDLLLGRGTTILDEENVRFAAHRWVKTRSQLIKEGYSKDVINELPAYTGAKLDTPEKLARDRHHLFEGDNPADKSTDYIEGFECYLQVDYDGDGVAEWRKVNMAGMSSSRELLDNEEWEDDLPFSDIVPDPVPHRWRGRSLFDLLEDVQKIKTVLMRQTLDNVYQTNVPTRFMLENGVVNPDALQDLEIGATIVERTAGAVRWDDTPFTADKTFGILEYLDAVVDRRTGMSRANVALDIDQLQDQTATAVRAVQAATHSKVEEYARNIAEHGGMKRIFSKCLKLIVKHQDRARTIRLRDEWVTVDPRSWNAEMDVTINTGLGSGSREHDLTMLMGIAAKQEQVIMKLGPTNPILGIDSLFDTYRMMVEAAGIKSPERFFPQIPPEVIQQMQQAASQQTDPKVQAAQIGAQLDAQKMQQDAALKTQELQQKAELERQAQMFDQNIKGAQAQRDAELQQMQLERQAQIEDRQAQADLAVQQQKQAGQQQLDQLKFQFDARMEEMKMGFEREKQMMQAQLQREKFEFEKQLKLFDARIKLDQAAIANAPKDVGAGPELNKLVEDLLPVSPLQQMVDSHTQSAKNITDLHGHIAEAVNSLTQAQADHSKGIATVLAEVTKPRRMRVVRDQTGRVTGSESF